MAVSDTVVQATDTQIVPAAAPTSGPTHQQSGANGPDPTGLRASLEKNLAAAAQKATEQTNAAKKPATQTITVEAQRGPDGKFLPRDTAVKQDDKPAQAQQADQTKPDAATQPDADEPPSSWRKEAKDLWKQIGAAAITPEQGQLLKEELRKRENDFKNGILAKDGELKTVKPFYDELQNIIKPDLDGWKAQGISPVQAINHLIGLGRNFRQNPAGTIQWLAKTAGLDLASLVQGQAQQTGSQQGGNTDPQLQPLLQEINGLKSELLSLKNGFSTQSQTAAQSEIQAFIDEVGTDGQPLRPHFNDAYQDIQMIMPAIRAAHPGWTPRQVVSEAYDRATWSNPAVRQKMIDAGKAQEAANQDASARQRAAEAAAKSATPGSSPNNLSGAVDPSNLRSLLTSKMTGAQARI